MLSGGAQEESLISRTLVQGFKHLRFPEPLEGEFRSAHLLASHRWVRLSLVVALSTTIGFAFIDHSIIRGYSSVPDFARFGLQLPVLVVCLIATLPRFYARCYVTAVQIGAPLFGLGTVLMASYARPEHAAMVGSRLLLVAFFFYFMLGLRMGPALRSNVIVMIALIAAGMMNLLTAQVCTYLAFALVAANVIGAAGAYALEHANRTSFLERKLLVEIAELDGLTRLLNRQSFEQRIRSAWQRSIGERHSITVIMVDVDHFKAYNDHYGHQAGDECLRRIASAVRAAVCTRPEDFVARYGGEEIIAVVSDRSSAEAIDIAQSIVRAVESLDIAHSGADSRRVSASVGAATQFPPFTASYDALLRLADGALYTAKRQGRNRSIVVEARASAAA